MRRMDRNLPATSDLLAVLERGTVMQIAMIDRDEPYIVSMNYGFHNENGIVRIYFHSAPEGRKIRCMVENPRICFTIAVDDGLISGEKACDCGMRYRSVVGYGKIRVINEEAEKKFGLDQVMRHYTEWNDGTYDSVTFRRTLVGCIEVETITGKQMK